MYIYSSPVFQSKHNISYSFFTVNCIRISLYGLTAWKSVLLWCRFPSANIQKYFAFNMSPLSLLMLFSLRHTRRHARMDVWNDMWVLIYDPAVEHSQRIFHLSIDRQQNCECTSVPLLVSNFCPLINFCSLNIRILYQCHSPSFVCLKFCHKGLRCVWSMEIQIFSFFGMPQIFFFLLLISCVNISPLYTYV